MIRLMTLLMSFLLSSAAFAQQGDGEPTTVDVELDAAARIVFQRARTAFEEGDYETALSKFQQAYELSPRPLLLYNIAATLDRLRRDVEAVTALRAFLELAPDTPDRVVLEARVRILEERNAQEQAEREQGEQAAQIEGARREREEREAAESQQATRSYVGPIAAFAVAGVGLITFGVAGGIALGRFGDLKTNCEDRICDEADADAVDRAALVADIGLGVAVAGAALGVILLVVGGKSDEESEEAHLQPSVGRHGGGLSLQGSF